MIAGGRCASDSAAAANCGPPVVHRALQTLALHDELLYTCSFFQHTRFSTHANCPHTRRVSPGSDSDWLTFFTPRAGRYAAHTPDSNPACIYDEYSIGPSIRLICTRCCFKMTDMIQLRSSFHWGRVFVINSRPHEIWTTGCRIPASSNANRRDSKGWSATAVTPHMGVWGVFWGCRF